MPPPLLTLQDVHLTFGGTALLEGAELSIGERERDIDVVLDHDQRDRAR